MTIFEAVAGLIEYGIQKKLIEPEDEIYIRNSILSILSIDRYDPPERAGKHSLEDILDFLCDYAVSNNIIPDDNLSRDMFDTLIMGLLTPRPSEIASRFYRFWQDNPEKATDYFYNLCRNNNYIRTKRIEKDKKWTVPTEYGELDITINLSKPEKDPLSIAAEKRVAKNGYPKCLLCLENEGYPGRIGHPARQNLRIIPIKLGGEHWGLQYSPYVYYNEHCIAINSCHTPMKTDRNTFVKLTDFVTLFPHYFIGSNADLPIVGGSILSHDHFQGGRYTFAMEKAPVELSLTFKGFKEVGAGIVKWPMSVIRLYSEDKNRLTDLCEKILNCWRGYTDTDAFIFAETEKGLHNTITPIARRKGDLYEIDLVLRNNITTDRHPLGVYHPHADKHHIKRENIGLIEVMGLAVLPSRLQKELEIVKEYILNNQDMNNKDIDNKYENIDDANLQDISLNDANIKDIKNDSRVSAHADWVYIMSKNYPDITQQSIDEIIQKEIGLVFLGVLEDAGVYKCTPAGRNAFLRFIDFVNKA